MAIAQVTAGNRITTTDLNSYYSLLKGVAGELITLINESGIITVQPANNPAASTDALIIKNAAGTTLGAITYDGKFEAADGAVGAPGITFDDDTNTGFYRSAADTLDVAVGGVRGLQITTTASGVNYLDIAPSATGNALTLTAEGTDTDISVNVVPKGAGTFQIAGSGVVANTSYNQTLGADVTIGAANTWTDVLSQTSVPAGTYLATAQAWVSSATTTAHGIEIFDSTGSAHLAVAGMTITSAQEGYLTVTAKFTLAATSTIKLRAVVNSGTTSVVRRAISSLNTDSAPGNIATQLNIVRLS